MLPLAAVVVGALIGFVGSRTLRRPQSAAQAASVARTVGGTMGRRKGLTAPELQRACFSEMVRHVRVDAQGRSVAPARYLLQVHPDDLAVVNDAHDWFVSGLSEALTVASRDNGWVLDGAIDLKFEADPSRRPGVPNALAVEPATTTQAKPAMPGKSNAAAAPTAAAAASTGLRLVRLDTDGVYALGSAPTTIGRATDSTIAIDDTRVSRSHAVVAPSRTGWTVTDVGSSNGTVHNGHLLSPNLAQPLAAGDVIGIGPVELQVEAAPAAARPVGSRALDDRDRTRISGEVLPPNRQDPR